MKSTHILFCFLFILFFSCGNESEDQQDSFTIISVDPSANDQLSIDDIAEEVDAVKLEETDESLISYVAKVQRTDDYIFVLDLSLKKVLQFDLEGNYIKSIGKVGDGPEEIPMITSFLVDKESSYIYIAGQSKIVVYDFEGGFVRSISGFILPNYIYMRDGSLEIFRTETRKQREGNGVVKVPTRLTVNPISGEVLDSLELAEISLKDNIMFMVMDVNYYSQSSNDDYFFLSVYFQEAVFRDTLYKTSGPNLIPSAKLDFGEEAMAESGNKAIMIRDVFRSDRYLLSRYRDPVGEKLFLYDFEKETGYNTKGISGGVYSDDEPVRLRALEGTPNTYYFSAKKLEEGMTEEPNPTLYFVKLKN